MELVTHIRGQGYPLLCLHGHPGNGRCMNLFVEALCDRYQTIAPDLRGYGESRTAEPFEMSDHLVDIIALLDRLNIQRCHVLGWSLGGILAMELALRFPHRVTGLILIGTAARPRSNHPPITWQDNVLTAIASLINRVAPGWQWNIDTFGKRSLYRYLIQQHTPVAYQRLADEAFPAFWQTSAAAKAALSQALRQRYNRLADLSNVAVPSLVLCGECDRHITAEASRETADYLPHSTFKAYPQTAHLFPWEIPSDLLKDIQTWLDQNFVDEKRAV